MMTRSRSAKKPYANEESKWDQGCAQIPRKKETGY